MGKRVQETVIDATFAGLANPQVVFEIGREDIKSDRPGHILVEVVKDFKANGGFAAIQAERDALVARENAADATVGKRTFVERDMPQIAGVRDGKELSAENRD